MKILVKTLFDCSITGTTGNFRPSQLPYHDRANYLIQDHATWQRSRNRQRNWETLLQVLGLRCQLENIEPSIFLDGVWQFVFEVDNIAVYGSNGDLGLLRQDCEGVPMFDQLGGESPTTSILHSQGQDQNIWFSTINT